MNTIQNEELTEVPTINQLAFMLIPSKYVYDYITNYMSPAVSIMLGMIYAFLIWVYFIWTAAKRKTKKTF